MPKRGRHRRGSNPAPHRVRSVPPPRPRDLDVAPDFDPDLLTGVRHALHASHPLALLELVSGFLTVVDPRMRTGFGHDEELDGLPTREELVESFLAVDVRETSALLAAIGELVDDEVLRARIQRAVRQRGHELPRWLTHLSDAEVYEPTEMVHVLGDGDDLMLGVRFAGGREATVFVYVDHNLGTLVKDAFVVEGPIAELVALTKEHAEVGSEWRPLDAADARARITECIRVGAMTYPPFETDTWPLCRPLVEWVARELPTGGAPYEAREWSDAELGAITERFLASPEGRAFDDDVHRELLDSILWFASAYGVCHPLRWSPVRVELLLGDWVPRKIAAPVVELTQLPDLLRAYVVFSGTELGLPAELVDPTVAAVDQWEPEYQSTIRTPRLQGPLALLDAMGVLDRDTALREGLQSYADLSRRWLSEEVGGDDALDALDDEPLPDEPFDWEGIPDDVHERVGEVLAACDRCCDALFDVELRTACRRLLAAVARAGPSIFRRRGSATTAASAICWIVGKANHTLSSRGPVMVKDMAEHFGLASPAASARAQTCLRALGLDDRDHAYGEVVLHSVAFLTSARRRQILTELARWTPSEP